MRPLKLFTFSLMIAFFLPGLAGFYSLGYWFPSIMDVFMVFKTAESNVGLFLLVFSGSLILGLQITIIRWFVYEKIICRKEGFTPSDFKKLGEDNNRLNAFEAVVEAHYSFHQFWGGMSVVIPFFYFGYLKNVHNLSVWQLILLILLFILIEALTVYAAIVGLQNYFRRGKYILRGDENAEQMDNIE